MPAELRGTFLGVVVSDPAVTTDLYVDISKDPKTPKGIQGAKLPWDLASGAGGLWDNGMPVTVEITTSAYTDTYGTLQALPGITPSVTKISYGHRHLKR
jgi:hypothetical protein